MLELQLQTINSLRICQVQIVKAPTSTRLMKALVKVSLNLPLLNKWSTTYFAVLPDPVWTLVKVVQPSSPQGA